MEGPDGAAGGHDFSFVGLIEHADIVVQAVIIGLLIASIVSWLVIFEKVAGLSSLRRGVIRMERATKDPKLQAKGLMSRILKAALEEIEEAKVYGEAPAGLRGRIEEAMRSHGAAELRRLETGLSFLATTGSSAPFVGLFGTVWGIMRSFTSIADAKDTSLAVVAPGIAEALVATAVGLAVAIPAVVAYNQILAALSRWGERLTVAIGAHAKRVARSAAFLEARG